MKNLIVGLFVFLSLLSFGANADDMDQWTENYNKMVRVLKTTNHIGDCLVGLSSDPHSPIDSWIIELTKNSASKMNFEIIPPVISFGRTQVRLLGKDYLQYRQADIIGWINMNIKLDINNKIILKLDLNKSLPDGSIYEKGFNCEIPNRNAYTSVL